MSALEELDPLLDPGAVSRDPEDLRRASRDLSPRGLIGERSGATIAAADAVVRPATTEDVAEVLRWAQETRTPVVPRGAGSGVCEAVAARGGIVLDLGGMNEVIEIDDRSLQVTVQAGCLGNDLQDRLAEHDLMLGHQPQSIAISSVGGWLATRACGQLSAAYGGIEEIVAGFEAALPGGAIVRRKNVPRRSAGPDVAWLLLGSEGTLGVVTEVTLRVVRVPVDRTDVCLSFEHMGDGVKACRALAQSDLHPTLVRLYDREDALLLLRNVDHPPAGPILLLSFEGFAAAARADAAAALAGGEPEDPAHVEHWWEHRNDAVEQYTQVIASDGLLGPHAAVDTMEVAGTWTVLRDLYHSMKSVLSERADLAACHLSHVYPDGACLYFTVASACDSDDTAHAVLDSWWEAGMTACLAAGGSISHHHGIGRAKARWMPDEHDGWFDVLERVKRVFDPEGIMNPGALGL